MPAEKIFLKTYKNEESRDSLFTDIVRQHPGNLFLLGDLTSMGSNERAWLPLDGFVNSLHSNRTRVFAIPGNHEYMLRSANGMKNFTKRFPEKYLNGYTVTIDSIAIVMLNSNFNKQSEHEFHNQLAWYESAMDSLETDRATRAIMVCTHHAPFSNSKIVGSSEPVERLIVPKFEKCKKAVLFLSGHSHNLEYFTRPAGKHYVVIGGGGGITQPLLPMSKRVHQDLLEQDSKPLYFYLVIERKADSLKLTARGFKKDFRFFEYDIGEMKLNQ